MTSTAQPVEPGDDDAFEGPDVEVSSDVEPPAGAKDAVAAQDND